MTPAVPYRLLRSGVAVLVAAVAGAGGHALSAGRIEPVALLGAAAVLMVPAWLLAGRQRDWSVIAGAELAGQELVHLMLGAATDGSVPSASAGALLPHDMVMPLHAAAALLAAAWLQVGERRAWASLRRAVTAWWGMFRTWVARVTVAGAPPVAASATAFAARLRHVLVRRGPPLQV